MLHYQAQESSTNLINKDPTLKTSKTLPPINKAKVTLECTKQGHIKAVVGLDRECIKVDQATIKPVEVVFTKQEVDQVFTRVEAAGLLIKVVLVQDRPLIKAELVGLVQWERVELLDNRALPIKAEPQESTNQEHINLTKPDPATNPAPTNQQPAQPEQQAPLAQQGQQEVLDPQQASTLPHPTATRKSEE